ncbi:MAG: hypothetical protein R6V04_14355 [bacterium]
MIYLTDNLRNNKDRFNTIVFDVDGVLVDTSCSYTQAVLKAVSLYGSNIMGYEWRPDPFHYNQFKAIKGFNNDWDIAEALLLYFLQKEILKKPLSFFTFISESVWDGRGIFNIISRINKRMNSGNSRFSELYKKEKIRKYAMELYAGTDQCKTFFGFDPELRDCPGMIDNEKVLIDTAILKKLSVVTAVFTGRNVYELRNVFNRIGYSGWREEFCFCDDSGSPKKPDPEPLCTIADSSECTGIIFAGDSRDDCETAKNFSKERPDFPFEFVQIIQPGSRFNCRNSALNNINQLLYFLLWEIS